LWCGLCVWGVGVVGGLGGWGGGGGSGVNNRSLGRPYVYLIH